MQQYLVYAFLSDLNKSAFRLPVNSSQAQNEQLFQDEVPSLLLLQEMFNIVVLMQNLDTNYFLHCNSEGHFISSFFVTSRRLHQHQTYFAKHLTNNT